MTMPAAAATEIAEVLARRLESPVSTGEPLARFTTFGLGGCADIFVNVASLSDLKTLRETAWEAGVPVTPLGDGSNCLISDLGVRGIVIKLSGEFLVFTIQDCEVDSGAGVGLSRLVAETARAGLAGLEVVYGVPGSVGGSVYMNAGTRYGWTSDTLIDAVSVRPDGREEVLSKDDLEMSYRHTRLQDMNPAPIVARARFHLRKEDPSQIKARIAQMAKARQASQPLQNRSCGCMFTNPEGDSAGRVIDACGLKGLSVGDVRVSEKHANFFVTGNSARASDVRALARKVQEAVRKQAGIDLNLEVKLLGEWPDE